MPDCRPIVRRWSVGVLTAVLACGVASGEKCTTQSAMTDTDRNALAGAGRAMAEKVLANDAAGLQAITIAEYAQNFGAIQAAVGNASAKVKGATLVVEQVYLLDASDMKPGPDGKPGNAQFLCTLNRSIAEADFSIPSLPAGKYGFVIVEARGIAAPWRLSFLMEQVQGQWQMAGFYPGAMTAAGRDGLWYWTAARTMAKSKEQWNAWLYYRQAEALLNPSGLILSTHLEKLHNEQASAAPPALSGGISMESPLVVKGADGVEYHFIGLGVDDSLATDKIDVMAHLKVEQIGDAVAARKRNLDAMSALLGAYPELRKGFHGVWIVAEVQGQPPYATELAMNEVR
ncbi:hypothetical protein [Edaphobacter modestus]|uniref:hypothetical protein n=1 Tax=Edaphobacter modestus TaxID=388466 RepID=UPI001F5EA822|nr:hypothetical protein [Edaphobacter modestus]